MAENDARLLIVLEAKIDKLTASLSKANSAVSGHANHVETALKKTDAQWNKLFQRAEPGKAIEGVFSRARLGLIEQGGTKIGLFGSALEHLGGLGLVTAAGLAATGVAIEQVVKAAEFSENLEKTAKAIGLTTTALQEYDFVALASGISTDTFHEALQGLNEKIGQVQSGIAGGKVKKVFDALGISAEQLRSLGDLEHILPVIADKLAALPAAERAGLAARLDIAPILPALLKGKDGIAALTQEAHKLGLVLDEDVVKKSAEAAEKMKIAADVIDKNLKAAFATLAPAIADVVTQLTQVLTQLAKIGAFKLPGDLNLGNIELASAQATAGDYVGAAKTLLSGSEANRLKRLNVNTTSTADILTRLGIHAGGKPGELVHGTPKAGPHDDTDARLAAANEAAAAAARALAEAQKGLTQDIDERAALELAAAKDEAAEKQARLSKQLSDLLKDKGIEGPDSDKAQRQIEAAQRDVAAAYEAQAEAIERNADAARDTAAVQFKQRVDEYYQRVTSIQSQLADTAADRLAIEKRDLLHRQELEREALQTENAIEVINKRRTQAQADQLTAGLAAQQGAERASFSDSHLTPLQSYLEAMRKAAADTDTAFSQLAVDGLTAFNDGIVNAIVNFKSLGDVARSVLQAIESDLVRILLNKAENALFNGLLGGLFGGVPGFADGTDFAPGGLAIVGERGPELVGLPRGANVTPNHELLKSVGRINTAGGASGGSVVVLSPTYEIKGAVMTQDLVNQMRAMSARATQDAVAISKAGLPALARSRRLLND